MRITALRSLTHADRNCRGRGSDGELATAGSIDLPPHLAAAALHDASWLTRCGTGFALADAYRFVVDHGLRLGVGGWHQGKARDLWKFQKLKGNSYEPTFS